MILLDTHVWVWWVSAPNNLSSIAKKAIDDAASIGVSAISVWEIATKVSKGKIQLDRPLDQWLGQALGHSQRIIEIPIDTQIAHIAGTLGAQGFHGDPADRLLAATAKLKRIPLVTKDRDIHAASLVETVW